MTNKNISKLLCATLAMGVLAGCGTTSAPFSQQPTQFNKARFFAKNAKSAKASFNTNVTPQTIPNQVIVKAKSTKGLSAKLLRNGLRTVDSFTLDTPVYLLESATRMTAKDISALNNNPEVEFAQPNYMITLKANFNRANVRTMNRRRVRRASTSPSPAAPNDPLFAEQWSMKKVNALQAWNSTKGNQDFLVSVVDTGIDYDHPELKGRTLQGKDYTSESDNSIDGFGHGTHVAGIINAAANNGQGMAGLAPGVKTLSVKVLAANGAGSLFAIAGGIHHSVKRGAKVVNLSLGGPAVKDPISTAVGWWATRKGSLLVAAAGNSAGPIGTPARIDDYFMAVGASDESDKLAKFSCYGKELSVVAPGTNIMSTLPTYKVPINDMGFPLNYAPLNGTSMAAPLVSGLAALVWSNHPEWNYKQVRKHIEKTSLDLGTQGKDNTFGHGRVDAFAALR